MSCYGGVEEGGGGRGDGCSEMGKVGGGEGSVRRSTMICGTLGKDNLKCLLHFTFTFQLILYNFTIYKCSFKSVYK